MKSNSFLNKSFCLLSLISLCFLILFVKLSLWQFNRSVEKANMLVKIKDSTKSQIINKNNKLDINKLTEYSHVVLQGSFDYKNTILLSNQSYNHQQGYHVITPFILDLDEDILNPAVSAIAYKPQGDSNIMPTNNSLAILINRGFISESQLETLYKQKFTSIKSTESHQDHKNQDVIIKGIIRKSNSNQYIMGDNIQKNTKFNELVLIQKIDLKDAKLLKLFPYKISSNYINLLYPSEYGFVTDWQWTNITPEKHKAYAITWLSLAITVILLYSYLCRINRKNK